MHPLQIINFNDTNKVYVVEASAGTGKTWTIERLFIKALLEAMDNQTNLNQNYLPNHQQNYLQNYLQNHLPVSITNILVVTFTNDATDELRQRIQEQLYITINTIIYFHNQLHNQLEIILKDDIFSEYLYQRKNNYMRDITILTRAYQNFDAAKIYTIHGFCKKILEDYQFDCRVNVISDSIVDKSAIIEEIVRDFIRSEIISKNSVDTVLNNLNQLFISNNYQLSLEQKIVASLPKDLLKIENNSYVLKYKINSHPSLNMLFVEEMHDALECKAQFLSYLIKYIATKYPEYCAKINGLSYDELIQRVADSLRYSDVLADKLFNEFPIAFIDEFQDTDALQWEIFSAIYKLDRSAAGSSRGNVVVVGDPKQAIYGFRGADVGTYIEAKGQIETRLNLTSNFRSHSNIMNFINQLFALTNQNSNVAESFLGSGIDYSFTLPKTTNQNILPDADTLQALLFNNYKIDSRFYDAQVHLVVINGEKKADRLNKLLLSMTFEILALLKAQPQLKSRIAILVTKNREGTEVVQYLSKYGIKAAELKLGNIFATTTAKNLYLFLSALLDLTDYRSFVKAVTTSLFNLPLTMLATDNVFYSDSVLSDNTDSNGIGFNGELNALQQLQEDFFIYQQIWNRDGIISLVYALLNNLINKSVSSVTALTNRELANLWQLAELLHGSNLNNQTELLYWFKQKMLRAQQNSLADLSSAENDEELVRLDNDDEQIIVTTQHKAKGLEYDILFCPYFKNGIVLDGQYDFKHTRPFFSNYRYKNKLCADMIIDKSVGEFIVENDNKEAHRLNYVALTRAKSRIYIYLKQHTYNKKTGKYDSRERPDKLAELFGYVKNNPQDRSHPLFNYPDFFTHQPDSAIKDRALFPGVAVYNRDDISVDYLEHLSISSLNFSKTANVAVAKNKLHYVSNDFMGSTPAFYRQSYSAITSIAVNNAYEESRNAVDDANAVSNDSLADNTYHADFIDTASDVNIINNYDDYHKLPEYRYSILEDSELRGAKFGILFHALCEQYPPTTQTIELLLNKYNIKYGSDNDNDNDSDSDSDSDNHNDSDNDNATNKYSIVESTLAKNYENACCGNYVDQLKLMLEEAFSYPIINGMGIKNLPKQIHELEFNLQVKNGISIATEVSKLLAGYFGLNHPFTIASKSLGNIEPGFLLGFIDLLFEYEGKYWVLDYKTNQLNSYDSATCSSEYSNPLIESMAEHHYYLQYLLYLVAVKRYLQQQMKLDDTTNLLGGAIYYYVRGVYCNFSLDKCGDVDTDLDKFNELDKCNKPGKHSLYTDNNCAGLIRNLDALFK
ncbi:MAG: exodeoxyribonuclease beta subunit [Pseudomonadota bacterium]|nr:exodeoxyribonuclease beta subunit [Pseudomonadota bacterium]